jgi:hypothetical protein
MAAASAWRRRDMTSELLTWLQVATSLVSLMLAAWALRIAVLQLRPLHSELKRWESDRRRRAKLGNLLPSRVRHLVGYDPRFNNWDWSALFRDENEVQPRTVSARLSRSYSDFHRDLEGSIEAASRDGSVMVVDLLFVPFLLEQKLIAPLDECLPGGLEAMLRRRAELFGVALEQPARAMLRQLCTDQEGRLGALPLWVNTHGRMMPEGVQVTTDRRLSQLNSFDRLLDAPGADTLLADGGVQSQFMIFEFYAHMAYRGCLPFRGSTGTHVRCSLLTDPPDRASFAEAVADLAVRLHFYSMTADAFRHAHVIEDLLDDAAFRLEHVLDARMIRERLALWKPVFSSELLWHTLPRRNAEYMSTLGNETQFRSPYVRYDGDGAWHYLSALGGYGLCLPRTAAQDRDSVNALQYAFLSNPLLMHPYVLDMLPSETDDRGITDFVRQYARPRWPFWREVGAELDVALRHILLLLPRSGASGTARQVHTQFSTVVAESDAVTSVLTAFVAQLQRLVAEAGWDYDGE